MQTGRGWRTRRSPGTPTAQRGSRSPRTMWLPRSGALPSPAAHVGSASSRQPPVQASALCAQPPQARLPRQAGQRSGPCCAGTAASGSPGRAWRLSPWTRRALCRPREAGVAGPQVLLCAVWSCSAVCRTLYLPPPISPAASCTANVDRLHIQRAHLRAPPRKQTLLRGGQPAPCATRAEPAGCAQGASARARASTRTTRSSTSSGRATGPTRRCPSRTMCPTCALGWATCSAWAQVGALCACRPIPSCTQLSSCMWPSEAGRRRGTAGSCAQAAWPERIRRLPACACLPACQRAC